MVGAQDTALSLKGFFSYRPRRLIVTQPVQHGDDVVRGQEGVEVVGAQGTALSVENVFGQGPRHRMVT